MFTGEAGRCTLSSIPNTLTSGVQAGKGMEAGEGLQPSALEQGQLCRMGNAMVSVLKPPRPQRKLNLPQAPSDSSPPVR